MQRILTTYNPLLLVLTFLSICTSQAILADTTTFKITPFSINDQAFLDKQRNALNDISKLRLGREFNGSKNNDLEILQRLLDSKAVDKKQALLLDAMGVILGDLYVKEIGVHWVCYTDKLGKSRALQWTDSKHVLFPITMISRRVKAGVHVDINKLYAQGSKVLYRVIADENRRKSLNIK